MIRRLREFAVSVAGRNAHVERVAVGVAAVLARRVGGVESVIDEAVFGERPLSRTLQMLQWSVAVTGRAPLPASFTPGDHVRSHRARADAARALRARRSSLDATGSDTAKAALLQRQMLGLDDSLSIDQLVRALGDDAAEVLGAAGRRPQRGTGIDPGEQLHIVAELTSALGAVGVTPFLMSGTLLGFIRDGGFLPFDYDIDLGLVPGTDAVAVVDAVVGLPDYDVDRVGPRIVVTHRSGIVTDLFEHELRDGRWWHSTLIHSWWNTPFELCPSVLDGVRLWIPDDPERYLRENYGRWDHPVAFYDISFDTPNRVYRRTPEAVRYLHSRIVSGVRDRDRWRVESAVRELRDSFGFDASDALAASNLLKPVEHLDDVVG